MFKLIKLRLFPLWALYLAFPLSRALAVGTTAGEAFNPFPLEYVSVSSMSPLQRAAYEGDLIRVRAILAIDLMHLMHVDSEGRSSLFFAALGGQPRVARFLWQAYTHLRLDQTFDDFPLHLAVGKNNLFATAVLLGAGIPIDQPNQYGLTSLMVAAAAGHLGLVNFLISQHASMQAYDCIGGNVLHHTARSQSPHRQAILEVLIAAKPEQLSLDGMDCRYLTPLMLAAANEAGDLIRVLVQAGAGLHHQNRYGQTALSIAIWNRKYGAAALLRNLASKPALGNL